MTLPAPGLSHVCDFEIRLDPPHEMGITPAGTRRIIPVVGGTVTGPLLNGTLLNVGADWQTVQPGGVAQLDARYAMETHDGAVIEIVGVGIRHASPEVAARIASGEQVTPSDYYMRSFIRLETGHGGYDWVNRALFVATGGKVGPTVRLSVYRID
ncbi:hypothetical protein M2337_001747 [Sphingobium sp. B2D3A]|uniref:DUF3237 domain-containing protein n=1 Tax=unclassified Sphingobium TaxID=2611147 RepID=UPI00222404CF|nr:MULTISPECIES: DUF3237 domain-containing protein [unclassified Sphingobium]MCW2337514.1 hypothetical protein [Sphingobium sp. B2D3A]MCW2383972.1 hypothetical protein [Sphingobium sp. B2D3D]